MPVDIPFYQHVSLSQTGDLISGCTAIRKDVVLQVSLDLHDPCIGTDLSFRILRVGVHEGPMTPTILGGLHGIIAAGTASFGVLVSPPSPGLAGRVVGRCSFCSKTPSGTEAHIEAFVESSSVTVLLAQGTCCRSRTSKSFSSFYT
jgi:hypothetical protein